MTEVCEPRPEIEAPEEEWFEVGDNIFADLGLPDPHECLLKSQIAGRIHQLIEARGLTQMQAAKVMNITQPDVSEIVCGKFKSHSLDWMLNCLLDMGQ